MSTIAVTSKKSFSYQGFVNSFTSEYEVEFFNKKIVIETKFGDAIEFYGNKLNSKQDPGFITSGVLKVDGVEVAEISDVRADISTKEWRNLLLEGEYAPVRYVLGVDRPKGPDQEFTFFGGKRDDTITGESDAANFLFGGKGQDLFFATGSQTLFDGGASFDRVSYLERSQDGVTVNLADSTQNKGLAADHSYNSIEDVYGSDFDDKLIGDDAGNKLDGFSGDDTINGGGGRDTLNGGDGEGFNFVSYEGTPELGGIGAYVSLKDGIANAGGVAGEELINFDGVIGSSGRDRLIGDDRYNELFGEGGDDFLEGGIGQDFLRGDEEAFGSSGVDQFIFSSVEDGGDEILDYDIRDQIGISRSGFKLAGDFAIVDGVSFIKAKNAEAVTNGPTFLFDNKNDRLLFDADGKRSGEAEYLALVNFDNPDSLDASDFVLLF